MSKRSLTWSCWGLLVSTSPASQNLAAKSRSVVRRAATILVSVLFLPFLAFAQEDTLNLVGSYTGMYWSMAVSAYNRNAFVANFDRGLCVIDYSDPSNPESVTVYPGRALDIEIKDSLAYYSGGCLIVKDISDPLEPDTISISFCYPNWQFRLHLFDSLAFTLHSVPAEMIELFIINVADPANPQLLSTPYPPPYGTMHWGDICKKDNYVYWVDEVLGAEPDSGRIIVFDITDPTDPVPIVVDTCLGAEPHAIQIKDSYAYVAEGYGGRGIMVFDISDPYNIDSVGCFPIPEGRAWNVNVNGNYAYVCAHLQPTLEWDRIYVLDISDPTNPSLVTYYNTPGGPRDVFVDAPYVLVAEITSLLVFEASFLHYVAGDANGDGQVNGTDVVFIINYLYRQGTPPRLMEAADANGDCVVNASDVVYLINYLFRNGPPPQSGCAF